MCIRDSINAEYGTTENPNMDREAELKNRFALIDVDSNGSLEKSELAAVFGEHADEFLKFCDGNSDGALTSAEFVTGILDDTKDMSDEDFQTHWLDRMSTCIGEAVVPAAGEAAATPGEATLTDQVVTLSPYFKVHNMEEFKRIWKEDYAAFAHKDSCVHYAMTFSSDNRVHCREAYGDAAGVLQHLGDVDAPLKAVLDPTIAELERLEVHGPQGELDKLHEALTPLGALFYASEWGFRVAKPAQEEDSVIHLYPFFQMKPDRVDDFKKTWLDAYPTTVSRQEEEKTHAYSFSFDAANSVAACREAYADAEGVLAHLANVQEKLGEVLKEGEGSATLLRGELHGPASELDKLKETFDPLGTVYFNIEWGFRNAVN
eukprot:TRINITY_DN12614_c0_g1_i1.p1 TRINITY_DN12614_c0_g1~~TRINITY_DN12614_c0_g1_i1.p1  ORF type:complete len:384 (+),score=106.90 TRINITY_DN12614_c0_g1_i1:28-1152(+)